MAKAGEELENNLTMMMPRTEEINPIDARANGKNIIPSLSNIVSDEAIAIHATIEPQ